MMMNLITNLHPVGYHPGSWRQPDAWDNPAMNLEKYIETARMAERGLFDMVFLADLNSINLAEPEVLGAGGLLLPPAYFEPVTLLSVIAQHTSHIGLLATASTTFEVPFTLARKFASLDHISGGRSCWNIVTSSRPMDADNFGMETFPPREERYARAREFVEVCKGLWSCWEEDVYIQDKASGRYMDPSRIHELNHRGAHYSVRGPLNIPRMPQGAPVLFMAGQSAPGMEFAASSADCQFAVTPTKEMAIEHYARQKAMLARYGRPESALKILPGASIYVGRTEEEADAQLERLNAMIPPELGLAYLSNFMQMDLSHLPVDGPLPEPDRAGAGTSRRFTIYEMAQREGLSIRQTYERVVPNMGHVMFKGTGAQVADQMQDWYESRACDGFNIHIPHMPTGLSDFVELVVPELQKRGIYRREYGSGTLRARMGMPFA